MRRSAGALVLISIALAGCISGSPSDVGDDIGDEAPVDLGMAADEALFDNPQTFPHPSYGWPTLTNPPQETSNEWLEPVEAVDLPSDVTGLEHQVNNPGEAGAGAGIALIGKLAIVPSWQGETTVFDISDPTSPKKLASFGEVPGRDADTIVYPDGRILAVFATDAGKVPVWNLTDPTDPQRIGVLHPTDGSHNVAVVPGTPILYNANSAGGKVPEAQADPSMGQGITGIYKLSPKRLEMAATVDYISLQEATHVKDWQNGYGCHDISFHVSQDKTRAYCAGIEYTQIWDISDPVEPSVVVNIPVHHGTAGAPSASASAARFAHLAIVDQDADTLIVGDETGGGLAPACDAYVHRDGTTLSGPVGNLYFYDISDEKNPQLQSMMSPTHHYPSNPPGDGEGGFGAAGCTAHFGRLIPRQDRDLLAMAWYGAGVTLIDFSDPAAPEIVDQWNDNTNTWDVWYYQGRLFTGDLSRGMDVLGLSG